MNRDQKIKYLRKIINLDGSINELKNISFQIPWDSIEDLVVIDCDDLKRILEYFIINNCLPSEIEDWANILECREDIGYHPKSLKDIVDELANPILYAPITVELVKEKIKNIECLKSEEML
jgi:hypothetical protein